jgi:hypothetical protein
MYRTFVICPRILVGPFNKLFIDPSEEPYRRVCEGISYSLWAGCLLLIIATTPTIPPFCACKPSTLEGRQGHEPVQKVLQWTRPKGRRLVPVLKHEWMEGSEKKIGSTW